MKTIDTNKKPELPWDWITVEKNTKYGKVPLKLKLYEPKGKTLEAVKEEVKDMRPANWAVLQYLYENPSEVPEEFKNYWCYFFGTDLRGKDGVGASRMATGPVRSSVAVRTGWGAAGSRAVAWFSSMTLAR